MNIKTFALTSLLTVSSLALAEDVKSPTPTTAPEKSQVQQGTENVKQGVEKVGQGVSKVVNSTALEAKSVICPVVAETATKVYYAKDSKGYLEVLKFAAPDKDEGTICFRTEAAARERGFKAVTN